MAIQCFVHARNKWEDAYPKTPLTHTYTTGPTLYAHATDKDVGLHRSTSFVAGAIACWDDGGNGHVAWTIKDNGDGTMRVSESNWPIGQDPLERDVNIGTRGSSSNYKLKGFVYP